MEAFRFALFVGAAIHYGGIHTKNEEELADKAEEVAFAVSQQAVIAAGR